ncbi:MAG: 1-(5-phosphoribosyl)-5-[(5-phosphoribosylamino)methylideneamino]imidazole-4-carboxamide isomerase [Promethearchaeota archaeon]
MEIIPAIDISNGKCVRLFKGKKGTETIYFKNPLDALKFWIKKGAKRIHIVDLDGAWGTDINKNLLKDLIKNGASMTRIQVGGGIRNIKTATELINLGADRIIIGTLAVRQPQIIEELANIIGSDRLIVALDYKKEKVHVQGWTEETDISPFELGKVVAEKGAGFILFSSVESDGALTGPDVPSIKKMIQSLQIPLIVAGGIRDERDIEMLKQLGVSAVIIGKAFYEKKIPFSIFQKY